MNEQVPGDDDIVQEVAPGTPPTEPPLQETPEIGPPMEPVREPERIHALDVLRGFAIFGIFMVNIAFFSMPIATVLDPTSLANESSSDQFWHALMRALFEVKFITLFSILFGMGLVVQMQRAEKRGRPFVGLYLRRTFVLMALGLIHALGLWYGDILFVYSFVAIVALLLRKLQPRSLVLLGGGFFALSVLATVGLMAISVISFAHLEKVEAAKSVSVTDQTEVREEADVAGESEDLAELVLIEDPQERWDHFTSLIRFETFQPGNDVWVEVDIIAYTQGPMTATLIARAATFVVMLLFITVSFFGFRVLATFLFGMALMKLDFFNRTNRRWHMLALVIGLIVGLPGELFLVWSYSHSDYNFGWLQGGAEIFHTTSSICLTFGYIGALTLLVHAGALRWFTYALSCVGRTALSNYLLQTIVATYIMYWWGLGFFNEVNRPQQFAIVVMIYLCQLILSVLYLRVFRIGPFEWLWRSLTYLKLQPLLRQKGSIPPTVG
ncbi:MAG: DUF418 domain-containing protein [Planctomycetes bacterium]|nr:DUF418 domain-containing protein [Planctomycetota bacterium]